VGRHPVGTFRDARIEFLDWLAARVERDDQRAYAIIDKADGGRRGAAGLFFLLQVQAGHGHGRELGWSTVPP
jgi:hypothetical protein